MLKMIYTGMKRRRKETWYVSFVTFIAVLFMTGLTLFQNIMNSYVFSNNLHNYGDWVISSVGRPFSHPYLMTESKVVTGLTLVDEEGLPNRIFAGNVDENFIRLYDEILYEGRMPKADGEIAMDVTALAILGYSYDLGQTIRVSYLNSAEEIETAEFLLVGTLKNFSAIWNADDRYPLPNFIVGEKDFASFGVTGSTTYFYQLNPLYNEINTSEFAQSFTPSEEMGLVYPVTYNSYVYENKVWGTTEVFERVTAAIMAIGVLAIGYLMIAYTGKRREVYYRCRSIGASKMQIRGIVCFECIRITIPQIVFGMAGAYVAAFGCCKIAQVNQLMVEYVFDGELFLSQLGSAIMVVLLAMVATQFSVSDKRIAGNAGQVKPSKFKLLRMIAKRSKAPEKTVFQRQNLLHPAQSVVSAVFSVLVCGCMILCLFKINDTIRWNLERLDYYKDFTISHPGGPDYHFEVGTPDTHVYVTTMGAADMSIGAGEQFLEALKTSPGIKSIETYWGDNVHIFEWEGMEQSQVFQYLKSKQFYMTPLEYGMGMMFYEDIEDLKAAYSEELGLLNEDGNQEAINIDWAAIEQGEQAIMLVGRIYEAEDISDPEDEPVSVELEETTLKDGMNVDIVHFMEGTRTTVPLAAVLLRSDYPNQSYKLIGTRALAEKIMAVEGKELLYDHFTIMYDNTASYESTDKQLAALASNNGMRYYSSAERRRMAIQEIIQDVGIYGCMFMVILMVYMTLQNSFLSSRLKFMEDKLANLKRVGMSDAQYICSAVWSEVKDHLWIVISFFFGNWLIYKERIYMHTVLDVPLGATEERIIESAKTDLQAIDNKWFVLFLVVVYLLIVGTSVIRIKHMTERRK